MSEGIKQRKVGRPKLPGGQVKGKVFPLRHSEDDHRSWKKAARIARLSFSEWMRSTLTEAAKRATGKSA